MFAHKTEEILLIVILFHRLLHTHHHLSGVGTIGHLVAHIARRLSLTPPQETKKKTEKLGVARTQTATGN
jgi:hypothetical protein